MLLKILPVSINEQLKMKLRKQSINNIIKKNKIFRNKLNQRSARLEH